MRMEAPGFYRHGDDMSDHKDRSWRRGHGKTARGGGHFGVFADNWDGKTTRFAETGQKRPCVRAERFTEKRARGFTREA